MEGTGLDWHEALSTMAGNVEGVQETVIELVNGVRTKMAAVTEMMMVSGAATLGAYVHCV